MAFDPKMYKQGRAPGDIFSGLTQMLETATAFESLQIQRENNDKLTIGSEIEALSKAIEDSKNQEDLNIIQDKVFEVIENSNKYADTQLLGRIQRNKYQRKQQQFTEGNNAFNEMDDMIHSSPGTEYEGIEFSDTTPEFADSFKSWEEEYKDIDPENPLIYGITQKYDHVNRLLSKVAEFDENGQIIGIKQVRKRGEGTITDEEIVGKMIKYRARLAMGLHFAVGNGVITADELDAIMTTDMQGFKVIQERAIKQATSQIEGYESAFNKITSDIAKLESDDFMLSEIIERHNIDVPPAQGDSDEIIAQNALNRGTVLSRLEDMQGAYKANVDQGKRNYEYWSGYSWDRAKDQKSLDTTDDLSKHALDSNVSDKENVKGILDKYKDIDSHSEWIDLSDDEQKEYAQLILQSEFNYPADQLDKISQKQIDDKIKSINDDFRVIDSDFAMRFMREADKTPALDAIRGAYGLTLAYDGAIAFIKDADGNTWTNRMLDAVEKEPDYFKTKIQKWKKNKSIVETVKVKGKDVTKILPGYENVTVEVYADEQGNVIRHKNGQAILVDPNKPPPSLAYKPKKLSIKQLVENFNVKQLIPSWETLGKTVKTGTHLAAGAVAYSFVSGAVGDLAEYVTGREFVNEAVQLAGGIVLSGTIGYKSYQKIQNALIKQHNIDMGIIKEGKKATPIKPGEVPQDPVDKPKKTKPKPKKKKAPKKKMAKLTSSKNQSKVLSTLNKFKKNKGIGWILKYGKKALGRGFAWKLGAKMALGAGATAVGSFFSGGTASIVLSGASYALVAYDLYQLANVLIEAENNGWK